MGLSGIFAFGFALLSVLLVATPTDSAPEEKSCKMVMADFAKKQLSGMSECTKSMKFKNGKDKAAKTNCILRCVMMKEGVMKDDGTWPMETLKAWVSNNIPLSLQERMINVMTPCQELASQADPKDEFCKSYDPMIKCLMSSAGNVCN